MKALLKIALFLSLLFFASLVIAQPVWDPGFPALQSEARSIGMRVNLDQVSTVYYIVYRVSGAEPASGSLTAAQIRNPGTAPAGSTTSGNFAIAA
jgi:hypothetical protein